MKKKINLILYFLLFVLILTGTFYVYRKVEQKECREQKEIVKKFIDRDFHGIIIQYERVPRGMLLWLENEYIVFGLVGTLLENEISINDSIVKQKGEDVFIIYKKDNTDTIIDQAVIRTNYKEVYRGMNCE